MDFFGMDEFMDLLTKTKTDGSQVIRKLSRNETRQIEKYKKMGREEKKLYAVKNMNCYHECVTAILKEKKCDYEDCDIVCEFRARGICCLTFCLCELSLQF